MDWKYDVIIGVLLKAFVRSYHKWLRVYQHHMKSSWNWFLFFNTCTMTRWKVLKYAVHAMSSIVLFCVPLDKILCQATLPVVCLQVRELFTSLLLSYPSRGFVLVTLRMLSQLAAKSLTDIPSQVTIKPVFQRSQSENNSELQYDFQMSVATLIEFWSCCVFSDWPSSGIRQQW